MDSCNKYSDLQPLQELGPEDNAAAVDPAIHFIRFIGQTDLLHDGATFQVEG